MEHLPSTIVSHFELLSVKKYGTFIKSEEKKRDTFKNWPLIKNPQFLAYPHETW